MDQHSYIINFRNLLIFIVCLLVFDNACYKIGYPFFDKMNHLGKIKEETSIAIIGSSNVLWDLDTEQISRSTALKVNMFSIAGGTMEFRYYLLKDFLKLHEKNPPSIIVLHTDRFAFNRKRYGDESYKSLQGYYHSGILNEYLDKKWDNSFDSKLKKISKAYSLNSEAYFILSKMIDRIPISLAYQFVLQSSLSAENLEKSITYEKEIGKVNSKKQEWMDHYGNPEEFFDLDESFQKHYEMCTSLMKENPSITFILLDTPMIHLFEDKYFEPIRNIYKASESKNIKYIYIDNDRFSKDESIYFDASHLNIIGRSIYTDEFIKNLKHINLLRAEGDLKNKQ